MTDRVRSIGVVVPARDEELLLPACLASIATTVDDLRAVRRDVAVRVVVVLDRCSDGSADVVKSHPRFRALVSDAGRVGTARAMGMRVHLDAWGATPTTWLTSTDADTRVPAHWLRRQVALAESGHDLVVGTVEPDVEDAGLLTRWAARHQLAEGHPHVHGANLGLRASTYVAAGGFGSTSVHEDVHLVEGAKAVGARCVATDRTRVVTAGRLHGRVTGGFASYLQRLATGAVGEVRPQLAAEG